MWSQKWLAHKWNQITNEVKFTIFWTTSKYLNRYNVPDVESGHNNKKENNDCAGVGLKFRNWDYSIEVSIFYFKDALKVIILYNIWEWNINWAEFYMRSQASSYEVNGVHVIASAHAAKGNIDNWPRDPVS